MDADRDLEELLAGIYVSLTTGSNMSRGNYYFVLLCDKLGVDPDDLAYTAWMNSKIRDIS